MGFDRIAFTQTALDPDRSVVVEACAGSGKTWLLVSRMLRLLLAGSAPGQILAITFTRKAASEIQARLQEWLSLLAQASDEEALKFLQDRGLSPAQAKAALPDARGLFERVLQAHPPMVITTFHGWFGQVLHGAALELGLAGFSLMQAEAPLREEAKARLGRQAAQAPEGEVAQHLRALLSLCGQYNTQALLDNMLSNRAEFQMWQAGGGRLEAALAQSEQGVDPVDAFFAEPDHLAQLQQFADLLLQDTATSKKQGATLKEALMQPPGLATWEVVYSTFLTKEGQPRARKRTKDLDKRLGPEGGQRFLDLHDDFSRKCAALEQALCDQAAHRLNAHALVVGEALIAHYEALKQQRKVYDFGDLEIKVAQLLSTSDYAPLIQARMDARYKHILLDEFQDTNPLQWRILLSWLEAYEGSGQVAPKVFMVGDPKQSIYRFRRADVRIFDEAKAWLQTYCQAAFLPNDVSFRNAPALVDVLNALFSHTPAFKGFRPQIAENQSLPGGVVVLPLVQSSGEALSQNEQDDLLEEGAPDIPVLRDPLSPPVLIEEDLRRREEAQTMVRTLQNYVGRYSCVEHGKARTLGWGDVMILTRRRAILPEYERALREANIAYFTASRGGLLNTLEAQDMLAILTFLSGPQNNLALAHSLRTPVFDCTDDDLMRLKAYDSISMWEALVAHVQQEDSECSATLTRAYQLLDRWQKLGQYLPVHDVLDRIFYEGQVMARYPQRTPPAMWAGVQANLEAFMALSLNVDGGRYSSLTRFVAELRRLQVADEEQAPDEGTLAPAVEGGRVQILTIHGAKGLEAPLVWLIDGHAQGRGEDSYSALIDWPPASAYPQHFSMLGVRAEAASDWRDLLDQSQEISERERLNVLYVAMTRAKHVFFVSGTGGRNKLKDSDYLQIKQAVLRVLAASKGQAGLEGEEENRLLEYISPLPPASNNSLVKQAPAQTPVPSVKPVGERQVNKQVLTPGVQLGINLHAYLQMHAPANVGQNAYAWLRVPEGERASATALGKAMLENPAWQQFFNPAAYLYAANEQTFINAQAQTGRIDRLVEFENEVWILDYKVGQANTPHIADYSAQLNAYKTVVQQIYPNKTIRTMLLFSTGEAKEV